MRGRASRKPRALLRGMKVLDLHSGEELFINDSTTKIQYGGYVSSKMFDSLTDEERQDQIDGMLSSSSRDYTFDL